MWVRRWIGWPGLAAACLAVALLAMFWVMHDRAVARLRGDIEFLRLEIASVDPLVAELAPLYPGIRELLARKQVAELAAASRYAVPMLEELARRRPHGAYLTDVRDEGRRILISGQAAAEDAALAFANSLHESAAFSSAQLLAKQSDATGRVKFTVAASLKEKR